MTNSAASTIDGPDPNVVAAHNDAFRKLACMGETPSQPIQGRMHLTSSLSMDEDGLALEVVQAVGEFAIFEPENDPSGWHDFGAVDIRGEKIFWKIDLYFKVSAPEILNTSLKMKSIRIVNI